MFVLSRKELTTIIITWTLHKVIDRKTEKCEHKDKIKI